ncbi:hypothetical protein RHMOL_Rhmol10G0202200 [Rhododendron molle]|uniref:Uncharacterized protein n=2 Tax=Rhododendron molle TaxID=49168 RepID=A0ACC0M4L6_RHOML|nr:hypothetical protein RHMOL_Rhmol10G0202200 [Rhododendron molle]
MSQPNLYQVNLLADARRFRNTIEAMTTQLVEDPNFPYAFPYIHDFYQKHGAIPLPENEEEDGDEAIPVKVQIAFPDDERFIIVEVREEPEDEKVANKVTEEGEVSGSRDVNEGNLEEDETPKAEDTN